MIPSYSDNALMTKVRALYGKRLTPGDYDRLLACRTVGEIAAVLKRHPAYKGGLAQVQEDMIHRGRLESLLRRRVLDVCSRLMKYSYQDRFFMTMYIMKNEIEQLLLAVRLLNAGAPQKYVTSMPVYLASHMSFDLFGLARVRSFDNLLELLAQSPYYGIMGRFRPVGADKTDIVGCETALMTHYYATLTESASQSGSKAVREDLLAMLRDGIDLYNVSAIYRLKRYFYYPPERIRPLLLALPGSLPESLCQDLVEAEDISAMAAMLSGRRTYRRYRAMLESDTVYAEQRSLAIRTGTARKQYRFSVRPVIVVMSYLTLLQTEIHNLISIIEGVRYGVSADEIRAMLVM